MEDIRFNCPHCDQHIAAPPEMRGQLIDCPTCKVQILVEGNQRLPNLKEPTGVERIEKVCLFCGETILATAIKCKHCGEFLNQPATTQPEERADFPPVEERPVSSLHREDRRPACPNCSSKNIVKVSGIYQQGSAMINGEQTNVGAIFSVGTGGGIDIDPTISAGRFHGTQQTVLARRFSPPIEPREANRSGIYIGIGILLVGSAFLWFAFFANSGGGVLRMLILAGAGVLMIVSSVINGSKERASNASLRLAYSQSMEHWAKLWYCNSCGETFQINSGMGTE